MVESVVDWLDSECQKRMYTTIHNATHRVEHYITLQYSYNTAQYTTRTQQLFQAFSNEPGMQAKKENMAEPKKEHAEDNY